MRTTSQIYIFSILFLASLPSLAKQPQRIAPVTGAQSSQIFLSVYIGPVVSVFADPDTLVASACQRYASHSERSNLPDSCLSTVASYTVFKSDESYLLTYTPI